VCPSTTIGEVVLERQEPPSGTTIISSSRAAAITFWRWSRRGWL
jgi:hypothetical protein